MSTILSSKSVGSIVNVKENGVAQDFYVVRHNAYTTGRTLLLRRYTHSDRQWHTSNVNAYASCTLDAWFNNEYFNTLPADIRGQIAAVTIPYTPGNGNNSLSSLSRKVFAVSATELGETHQYLNAEGKAFDNAASLKITTDSGGSTKAQWSRSPHTIGTKHAWNLGNVHYLDYLYCTNTYGARPAFTLPSTLSVDDNGNIIVNTPPSTPPSLTVPNPVKGGAALTISWGASSDADGNLAGYKLERTVNGGGWSQVYQGGAQSYGDSITYGWANVAYRVRAYDSAGAESSYTISQTYTVLNNSAPTTPASITVPNTVRGGKSCTISWGSSTDVDGNLAGYKLERSVNSGSYEQIYLGVALTYTDAIARGWTTVTYRTRAYDNEGAHSPYRTSDLRSVINNLAPAISGTDADLGTQNMDFTQSYSVSDDDGDPITVAEKIDGVTLRTFTATAGAANTLTIDADRFMRLLNGTHTLTVSAADNQGGTSTRTWTFNKSITAMSIALKSPLPADAMPSRCVVNLTGIIAQGAICTVEVCNNANDAQPTWEDCTASVQSGRKFFFANNVKTAEDWGFGVRVTVDRAGAVGDCFISAVGGNFE